MYKVEIQNSKGKTVKTYEQKEIYILGAKMEKNRVILERAVRDGSIYTSTAEEYISNNEEQKESNIYLDSYVTELKKKQMRLTYEDGISDKEPKVLKPKQVMFENPTTITFDYDRKRNNIMSMDMENFRALMKLQAMPSKRQIRMEESWWIKASPIYGREEIGI